MSRYYNIQINFNLRIHIIFVVFFLMACAIIFRLYWLQIRNYEYYTVLAANQHNKFEELEPERGEIFIQDILAEAKTYPIAINKILTFVYANPKDIAENGGDPDYIATKVGNVLGYSDEEKLDLFIRLSKATDPYEPIEHRVTDEQVEQIQKFDFPGLLYLKEKIRYYPEESMGSHIIGFVGQDLNGMSGKYGLEGYFDKELRGQKGEVQVQRDATGEMIVTDLNEDSPFRNGEQINLTIEKAIQFFTCSELAKAVEYYEASSGTIIVMDPQSGAIMAMCSQPSFNPNQYNKVENIDIYNNPAIFNQYEPGSIFKPITMAAALDLKAVEPMSTYEDKGFVTIVKDTIRNSDLKSHGLQTMLQVLEKSLNTGTVYVAEKMGTDNFKKYIEDFGFGTLTGIELDIEAKGNINSLDKKSKIYAATASFGQGISVTPIQMVNSYAALANKGRLMKPYIVRSRFFGQEEVYRARPELLKQVISEKAAADISGMLVSVVENGHGLAAVVDGYHLAGKTGTAQVPDYVNGGYSEDTIHSFVGYGPLDDPKFVILAKLDKPNPDLAEFAANSVAPLFAKVAKFVLDFYGIPPEL